MLDIDYFKRVNDTHGHLAGDMALKTIATLLVDELRPSDTIARYGGEEIVALLPETDEDDALVTAERLRQAVASLKIDDRGTCFGLTVSIGVARWQALEPTIEAALARADQALYRVKNGGRNGVLFIAESPVDPTGSEQYSAHQK
jgi:diguanylate cyclase